MVRNAQLKVQLAQNALIDAKCLETLKTQCVGATARELTGEIERYDSVLAQIQAMIASKPPVDDSAATLLDEIRALKSSEDIIEEVGDLRDAHKEQSEPVVEEILNELREYKVHLEEKDKMVQSRAGKKGLGENNTQRSAINQEKIGVVDNLIAQLDSKESKKLGAAVKLDNLLNALDGQAETTLTQQNDGRGMRLLQKISENVHGLKFLARTLYNKIQKENQPKGAEMLESIQDKAQKGSPQMSLKRN